MKALPLWIPFALAFSFSLVGTALLPSTRIWSFAPFLVLCFYRMRLPGALWASFFCGVILDCCCSQFRFGLFSMHHIIGTLILHRQKRHFFEDKALSLPLYTALTSLVFSALLIMFFSWSQKLPLSPSLLVSDLLFMPLVDATYAFLWFTCPLSLIVYFRKHGLSRLTARSENRF